MVKTVVIVSFKILISTVVAKVIFATIREDPFAITKPLCLSQGTQTCIEDVVEENKMQLFCLEGNEMM